MAQNLYIILGNGFSIDLLNHVKKTDKIDVRNLFNNGQKVKWPGNDKSGFLSFKYCPNLWDLGARPYNDSNESMELIEDIITCANILQKDNNRGTPNNYIKAYKELSFYLSSLFIHYNKELDIDGLDFSNWGWYKFFQNINLDKEIGKVYIVTFNYDIWLERILNKLKIPFKIGEFESDTEKFLLLKPHGSISFKHKVQKDKAAFQIDYSLDKINVDVNEYEIDYINLNGLNSINAIIPPAGDSNRLAFEWANKIRSTSKDIAKSLQKEDELIICGISYWHVDRLEIDSILKEVTPEISNVKLLNPKPPNVLNAVVTTLFRNVILHTDSENLIN